MTLLYFNTTAGFTGENLISRTNEDLLRWYSGPTLIDCLDELPCELFDRTTLKKSGVLRFPVADVYKTSEKFINFLSAILSF